MSESCPRPANRRARSAPASSSLAAMDALHRCARIRATRSLLRPSRRPVLRARKPPKTLCAASWAETTSTSPATPPSAGAAGCKTHATARSTSLRRYSFSCQLAFSLAIRSYYRPPLSLAVLTVTSRAPWLWLHVSPSIPILFAYLFLVSVSSFLHASASDPGVSLYATNTLLPLISPDTSPESASLPSTQS